VEALILQEIGEIGRIEPQGADIGVEGFMIIRRTGDWIAARVDEELVMMSVEQERYLGLNETGCRVWELLEAPRDVADLCRALEREFEVAPDLCRAEVGVLLEELAERGVVVAGNRTVMVAPQQIDDSPTIGVMPRRPWPTPKVFDETLRSTAAGGILEIPDENLLFSS
jgi:hypothetical protein